MYILVLVCTSHALSSNGLPRTWEQACVTLTFWIDFHFVGGPVWLTPHPQNHKCRQQVQQYMIWWIPACETPVATDQFWPPFAGYQAADSHPRYSIYIITIVPCLITRALTCHSMREQNWRFHGCWHFESICVCWTLWHTKEWFQNMRVL